MDMYLILLALVSVAMATFGYFMALSLNKNRMDEKLQVAEQMFENSVEGIMVTTKDAVIMKVNPAFTEITGYNAEEAVGRKPNILRSNRHDKKFYEKMWGALLADGKWQGEIWNRKKNGEAYPEWLTILEIKDRKGEIVQYMSVFYDITDIKKSREKIEYQANYDALTGLANRQLFRDRLDVALAYAKKHEQKLAVLVVDLDNFKKINESLGHITGDMLLQRAAKRLTSYLRDEDTVARAGGDEFLIILAELEYGLNPADVGKKVVEKLSKPFNINGADLFVGASVGIAIYPADGDDGETLTKNADIAMYRAKLGGKSHFRLFTNSMHETAIKRFDLENNLRKALQNNEIIAYYQPKIDVETGVITGMEALARWCREGGKIISPAEFIPIAEETGLIVDIDQWILRMACDFTKKLHDQGHGKISVTVNLSARQFESKNLVEIIAKTLQSSGLGSESLGVELTESSLVKNIDRAIATMKKLRDIGINVSIDDFGTGYSSLSYLKRLPIDILKIDMAFVKDLPHDNDSKAIARAIASMAHEMSFKVVAEGVERQDQLDFLKSIGCDEIQGYIFSPPVTSEGFEKLLNENKPPAR